MSKVMDLNASGEGGKAIGRYEVELLRRELEEAAIESRERLQKLVDRLTEAQARAAAKEREEEERALALGYTEHEIWLEKQMKELWERTRGNPPSTLQFGHLLTFWDDPNKLSKLSNSDFTNDWISALYQRVSYLISGKALLGSVDDNLHQAKVILSTVAILEQMKIRSGGNFLHKLIRDLDGKSHVGIDNELCQAIDMVEAKYPIFYKGFHSTRSKAAMQAYISTSGHDLNDNSPSIDDVVVYSDEVELATRELEEAGIESTKRLQKLVDLLTEAQAREERAALAEAAKREEEARRRLEAEVDSALSRKASKELPSSSMTAPTVRFAEDDDQYSTISGATTVVGNLYSHYGYGGSGNQQEEECSVVSTPINSNLYNRFAGGADDDSVLAWQTLGGGVGGMGSIMTWNQLSSMLEQNPSESQALMYNTMEEEQNETINLINKLAKCYEAGNKEMFTHYNPAYDLDRLHNHWRYKATRHSIKCLQGKDKEERDLAIQNMIDWKRIIEERINTLTLDNKGQSMSNNLPLPKSNNRYYFARRAVRDPSFRGSLERAASTAKNLNEQMREEALIEIVAIEECLSTMDANRVELNKELVRMKVILCSAMNGNGGKSGKKKRRERLIYELSCSKCHTDLSFVGKTAEKHLAGRLEKHFQQVVEEAKRQREKTKKHRGPSRRLSDSWCSEFAQHFAKHSKPRWYDAIGKMRGVPEKRILKFCREHVRVDVVRRIEGEGLFWDIWKGL